MAKALQHKIVFALALLLLFFKSYAQVDLEKIAKQYQDNKEYDKALELYEHLFNQSPEKKYYKSLITCYYEIPDYKSAEKLIKKQIKRNPADPSFDVDLGNLYEKQGEKEKAQKHYNKVIEKALPSQNYFNDLATSFISIKQFEFALKTYQKGRKNLKDFYNFNFEIAQAYYLMGDTEKMMEEYISILNDNENYLTTVQNALSTLYEDDTEKKISNALKRVALRETQKNPNKTVFYELLIWQFIQDKDFDAAFTQTKALDKRAKQDGSRIMNLASICVSNTNYDVAIKCYEYIITKGTENYFYNSAKMELVNVLNKKITESNNYTTFDLLNLEKNYATTLAELGESAQTLTLQKGYAHLKAFYLNKIDEAISILQKAITFQNGDKQQLAECKLELGDVLLLSGDVWESSLLYSQVEKVYRTEPLGQEAKFRNAKLSFYNGDFFWAQAQLDILKAATSRLIANDAIYLSLLITDNTGLDSITEPLLIYSRADLLSFQNKDSLALITLDSIAQKFSGHTISDDVLFKKYKIYKKKQQYTLAASMLEKITNEYAEDILGDDAYFYLAELNEYEFKNTQKAQEIYQQILVKYPGSTYGVEARKRFRNLRGDKIN
ncbi:MAG: tetratricopeptide repeat protein [Bacteroidota bacterium]